MQNAGLNLNELPKMNDPSLEGATNGDRCLASPDIDLLVLYDEFRADRGNAILPLKSRQQPGTQTHFLAFDSVLRYKNRLYDPRQVLQPVLPPRESPTGNALGADDFVSTGIQRIPQAER
jgi:hypothetical protein